MQLKVRRKNEKSAIQLETTFLKKNCTWEICKLSPGENMKMAVVLDFTDMDLEKLNNHKARRLATPYIQQDGNDYTHRFSPLVRLSSLIILLVMGSYLKSYIHHLDAKLGFLYGEFDQETYMEQPVGCIHEKSLDLVQPLKKASMCLKFFLYMVWKSS